jgi:hypothetical protein
MPEWCFSINECDYNLYCLSIALGAESLEKLPDARVCGQFGLDKNIPRLVKTLGNGVLNAV